MKAVFIEWLTNSITPRAPLKMRQDLYKKLGLHNSEEIRKGVFIQNTKVHMANWESMCQQLVTAIL